MEHIFDMPGSYTLDEINSAIRFKEAQGLKFKDSNVDSSTGEPINKVTFEELPIGQVPNDLTIVKQGAPQPSGTSQVWSGTMVVEGKLTAVIAYRAT